MRGRGGWVVLLEGGGNLDILRDVTCPPEHLEILR